MPRIRGAKASINNFDDEEPHSIIHGTLSFPQQLGARPYPLSMRKLEGHLTYYAINGDKKQDQRRNLQWTWRVMIQGCRATFKYNTTCPRCALQYGKGKHRVESVLAQMKQRLMMNMLSIDLEEGLIQEVPYEFRDEWIELEERYRMECGDPQCLGSASGPEHALRKDNGGLGRRG